MKSEDERRWRQLVQRWHPDKSDGDAAMFLRVKKSRGDGAALEALWRESFGGEVGSVSPVVAGRGRWKSPPDLPPPVVGAGGDVVWQPPASRRGRRRGSRR